MVYHGVKQRKRTSMNLVEYFQQLPRGSKTKLAKTVNVSKTWLALVINGHRIPSAELSVDIERATKGKVTRKELRPDIFGKLV
jgi:DNA-binding transcriptional regulator YdaS (Cro superfamily)